MKLLNAGPLGFIFAPAVKVIAGRIHIQAFEKFVETHVNRFE